MLTLQKLWEMVLFVQVYQQAPNHVLQMEDVSTEPSIIWALTFHFHLGEYHSYICPG